MVSELTRFDCFISYAKEDHKKAQDLYLALRRAGIRVWMDKPPSPFHLEGLLVGEIWETKIRTVFDNAQRVILLFSKNSVEKRGFVQSEFRQALVRLSKLPDTAIEVLPIRLDDCEIPAHRVDGVSFSQYQWLDCFDDNYSVLIDSILAHGVAAGKLDPFVASPRSAIEIFDSFVSGAKLTLDGVYDLSEADRSPRIHCSFEDVTDGEQAVFSNICGMAVESSTERPSSILVRPRYSNVIEFRNCEDIFIKGITFGHAEGFGYCSGGVVYLKNCKNIVFENCVMFGCGTYAFELTDCNTVSFNNCRMYGCTYGIGEVSNSKSIKIVGGKIFDNKGFGGISATDSDITITESQISQNDFDGRPHFQLRRSSIRLVGGSIHKKASDPLVTGEGLKIEGCDVQDRYWG